MTQRRFDTDLADLRQNAFEYMPVDLFRLDDSEQVSNYSQPFRVAFLTYLTYVLQLNQTDRSELLIPLNLLKDAPQLGLSPPLFSPNPTTQTQKAAYFLLTNGLRSLRTKSDYATAHQQASVNKNSQSLPFLAILIVGTFVTSVSIVSLLY